MDNFQLHNSRFHHVEEIKLTHEKRIYIKKKTTKKQQH